MYDTSDLDMQHLGTDSDLYKIRHWHSGRAYFFRSDSFSRDFSNPVPYIEALLQIFLE